MKALMCCSKTKPYLEVYPFDLSNSFFRLTDDSFHALNGKIVAECEIEIEEIKYYSWMCKSGYAIHIKNIQFIEEPYNVNEVWQYKKYNVHLKNAPKNMCAIYGKDGEPYVLITASSEELCRCLNKKQTVLVRREVPERVLKWTN